MSDLCGSESGMINETIQTLLYRKYYTLYGPPAVCFLQLVNINLIFNKITGP